LEGDGDHPGSQDGRSLDSRVELSLETGVGRDKISCEHEHGSRGHWGKQQTEKTMYVL
jgi:hypothetical protein